MEITIKDLHDKCMVLGIEKLWETQGVVKAWTAIQRSWQKPMVTKLDQDKKYTKPLIF